mgnify:CR=1 FL=1
MPDSLEGRRSKVALISLIVVILAVAALSVYVWRAANTTELIFERAERSDQEALPVTVNRNLLDRIEGYDRLPSSVKKDVVGSVQNACASTQGLRAQADAPAPGSFVKLTINCADGKRVFEYFAKQDEATWKKAFSGSGEINCAKAEEYAIAANLAPTCLDQSGQAVPNPRS